MIERKRGHIVAVSSFVAFSSVPNAIVYTTTKAGNDHFMNALYDDMCWQGHNNYIKLTTVYPGAIATQKQFQKLGDELCGIPLDDPVNVGDATVKAILNNQRKVLAPSSIGMMKVLK
jgi:short-subunit dehydrogenase